MLEALYSLGSGNGAISSQLDYICDRMDSILISMLELELIKAVMESCCQIGILLMLVFFLIDLLEKATDVQFSLDVLFKQLLKLVVAYAIMNHLYDLIMGMSEFSLALNEQILDTVVSLENKNFADAMGEVGTQVPSSGSVSLSNVDGAKGAATAVIFQTLMQIITWTLSVERALTIGFQSCLAPISCADIITNGMSSNGIRRIKTILANFMQTTLILLVTICINLICVFDENAGIISSIVAIILLWTSVKSSKELALEIFDAG